jgi:hypothetical protein
MEEKKELSSYKCVIDNKPECVSDINGVYDTLSECNAICEDIYNMTLPISLSPGISDSPFWWVMSNFSKQADININYPFPSTFSNLLITKTDSDEYKEFIEFLSSDRPLILTNMIANINTKQKSFIIGLFSCILNAKLHDNTISLLATRLTKKNIKEINEYVNTVVDPLFIGMWCEHNKQFKKEYEEHLITSRKYDPNYTQEYDDYLLNKNTHMLTVSSDISASILKSIKDNLTHSVNSDRNTIFRISIVSENNTGHANILIMDNIEKKFIYYDPEGLDVYNENFFLHFKSTLKGIFGELLNDYTFIHIESRIQYNDRFCATWSLFIVALYMANPSINLNALLKILNIDTNKRFRYTMLAIWLFYISTLITLLGDPGSENMDFIYNKVECDKEYLKSLINDSVMDYMKSCDLTANAINTNKINEFLHLIKEFNMDIVIKNI